MNDAKSMLMMYSCAAMKAAKAKEDTTKAKEETKTKDIKRRGKNNDKGTEGRDSTVTKE